MNFTRGMQKKLKKKKKKPRQCHIIDSAELHDIGGNHEESFFTRTESKKKYLQGTNQKSLILQGVKPC